jgi:hypothetical protein
MKFTEEQKKNIEDEFKAYEDSQYAGKDKVERQKLGQFFTPPILSIRMAEKFDIDKFDDNTVLYEYNDDVIIVHTFLGEKYILFDKAILSKIEKQLSSYRNLCL